MQLVRRINPKFAKLLAAAVIAACITYSTALRFTSFFIYSRTDKILLLISLFLLSALISYLLLFSFLPRLVGQNNFKAFFKPALFGISTSVVLFALIYQFPYFPHNSKLTITALKESNPKALADHIFIETIQKVDLPSKKTTEISLSKFEINGPYSIDENNGNIVLSGASSTTMYYEHILQGQFLIHFKTSAESGKINIEWNGQNSTIDLYTQYDNQYVLVLDTSRSFNNADTTRKLFLAFLFTTDFALASLAFLLLFTIIDQTIIKKKLHTRGLGLLFAIVIVSLALYITINQVQQEVHFSDPNLELAIREQAKLSPTTPIYKQQLSTIATLDISAKGITDLDGIENLRNLKELIANYNDIRDLRPLGKLEKLSRLSLENNGITDLEEAGFVQLSHLPLEYLDLDYNFDKTTGFQNIRLSEIEILRDFTTLEYLYLRMNHISDITPLSDLTALKELDLRDNKITDISHLETLAQLKELNLRGNDIQNISALASLSKLEKLVLSGNKKISQFDAIAKLTALRELQLRDIPLGRELGFLQSLKKLRYLDVRNCALDDLSVLGDLMAQGILQDNPNQQIQASLLIRDNPLLLEQAPPLKDIRPYWENITYRDPYLLPQFDFTVSAPQFSHQAGFYKSEFYLSISSPDPETIILYTMDGSTPNIENHRTFPYRFKETKIYEEALLIQSRAGDPNQFSMIKTANPAQQWIPLWIAPEGEVFKATIIRAAAYNPATKEYSKVITQSYFVDEAIDSRYAGLPIISLTADHEFLFDETSGIYTPAIPTGDPVASYEYNERKIPASVELIEEDGRLGFSGLYEVSLQGSTSRSSPQKGLHIIAESWMGSEFIDYPLFQDTETKAAEITQFKRFILRSWGSARDWPMIFSDAHQQLLLSNADIDIQAYRPVIVFINGEYWGLHEIREASKNAWYFQEHYGIDVLDPGIDLLIGSGNMIDEGDAEHWDNLVDFISTHDLELKENYQYVATQVDIDNFITYMIHGIFAGKRDWPGHNEAKWRPRTADGKWRWIQFDMDHGLNSHGRPTYDMVSHVLSEDAHPHPLFVALITNKTFKNHFLNTFADYLNTYFKTEVELAQFDQFLAELEPYLPEYQARWGLNQNWEADKDYALNTVLTREELRRQQLIDNFDLEGCITVSLITNQDFGTIRLNSLLIDENTPGIANPNQWEGQYFINIPITLTAIPQLGYTFDHWETNTAIEVASDTITVTLNEAAQFEAVFIPAN